MSDLHEQMLRARAEWLGGLVLRGQGRYRLSVGFAAGWAAAHDGYEHDIGYYAERCGEVEEELVRLRLELEYRRERDKRGRVRD